MALGEPWETTMGLGTGAEECGAPVCTEVLQQTVSVLRWLQLSDDQLELRLQGIKRLHILDVQLV